jgi:eukaryotic-like serine/threonine-protein kinase
MATEPVRIDLEGLDPIDRVIVDFLESADRGEAPSRADLLARYPQHRVELAQFLDDLARFDPAAVLGASTRRDAPTNGQERTDVTLAFSPRPAGHETLASGAPVAPDKPETDGPGAEFSFQGRTCGDYELQSVLGRGGMGVVFKARHRTLGRVVALKMISSGALASESMIRRFETEARAAAQLDHAGIVPLFEVGQHQGLHYFTMGYVDGPSLATVLAEGPLPARESARMMRDAARAMDYAHRHGVIHRDLKPANILLDGDRHPRISDFGLAKRVDEASDVTGTGQILGTPSYMAPEQALSETDKIGSASDIYGLGAVLFAMLTGRPPFQASTSWETLRHVIQEDAPLIRQLNPSVPRDLETICAKCLRKSPEQRYASASALADDLERYLNGEPIQARPIGIAGRMVHWYRRHPAVGSMAGTLGALLIAVPLLLLVLWREADARANSEAAGHKLEADAHREEAEARRKMEALERARTNQLFHAYVNEGSARRMSPRVGRRFAALDALGAARDLAGELNLPPEELVRLRSESINALSLTDLRDAEIGQGWATFEYPNPCMFRFAGADNLFLDWDKPEGILARRIRDNRVMQRIPDVSIARGDWPDMSRDSRFMSILRAGKLRIWRIDGDQPQELPGREKVQMSTFTDDRPEIVFVTVENELIAMPLDGKGAPRSRKIVGADLPVAVNWWAAVRSTSKRIAVASDKRVALYDAESLKPVTECKVGNVVETMDLSPDGGKLAIACHDSTVVFFRLDSGARAERKGPTGGLLRVSFDPSGRYVLSHNSWTGRNILWDFDSAKAELRFNDRELPRKLQGPTGPLLLGWWQAALDPPHWTMSSQIGDDPTPHKLGNSAIHPASRLVATQTPDGVLLGDLATGRRVGLIPTKAGTSLSFDADGNLFGYVNRVPHRWAVTKEGNRYKFGAAEGLALPPMYMCLAISPDGRYVAEPVPGGSMVLDRTTGKARAFRPQGDVRCVVIDPSGRHLASFGWSVPGFRIWEIGTGKLVQTYDRGGVSHGKFTPDGKHLVTIANDIPEIQLWSMPDLNKIRTLGAYGQFAVSPDSRLIAVVEPIGKIRLVRIDTGDVIARFDAPAEDYVVDIAFSPDGRYLMGVNLDETTHHIWDLWRLRRNLAERKLDWDQTPAPERTRATEAITVEIETAAKGP